jgi:S1-C subfamily serine protease
MRVAIYFLAFFLSCTSTANPLTDAHDRAVLVEIGTEEGRKGTCSGVIFKTGIVLTAAHCKEPVMRVDGKPAKVIKEDEKADLLLLSVETTRFSALRFGKTHLGASVFFVSSQPVYGRVLYRATVGAIRDGAVWIDTNGAFPGFSGSALFDERGNLVGLNHKYGLHDSPVRYAPGNTLYVVAVGIAVPADAIRDFVKES